jgi:hypothetical protein
MHSAFCLLPYALCLIPYALCLSLPLARLLRSLLPKVPYAFCLMPSAFCLISYALCLMLHTHTRLTPSLPPPEGAFCLMPYASCVMPYASHTHTLDSLDFRFIINTLRSSARKKTKVEGAALHADVCWRMLTNAGVCWRMLTLLQVLEALGDREAFPREESAVDFTTDTYRYLTDIYRYLRCWRRWVTQKRFRARSLMALPLTLLQNATASRPSLRYVDTFDVCWRMPTYADVCWRMLTYADVCRFATVVKVCGYMYVYTLDMFVCMCVCV